MTNYLSQILFFFGALGVFNSLLTAVFFLLDKRYAKQENRFFGVFLLILSLRVFKSLFYSFSTAEPIWFLQSGPSFFLLIGPLFLIYIISAINKNSSWLKHWKLHTLFWASTSALIATLVPFSQNIELNKSILLPIINIQCLIYLSISAAYTISKYKSEPKIHWLLILNLAIIIVWLFLSFTPFSHLVSASILFSLAFYLLLILLIARKWKNKVFGKHKINKKIKTSVETEHLINALEKLMDEKIYTNPDLKISKVASLLNTTTHKLSEAVNNDLSKNFNEFINEFRIQEAISLMNQNTNYTIEAIGQMSGFNSKSAFYKAFRKITGVTPTKYNSK